MVFHYYMFFLEFISFGVLSLPTYLEAREIRETSAKKRTSVLFLFLYLYIYRYKYKNILVMVIET
jgi:hypothetical protein